MGEVWPKKCEQGKDRRDQLGSPNADSAVAVARRWFFVDTSSPPVTIAFELDLQTPSFVCSVELAWVENGPVSLAEISRKTSPFWAHFRAHFRANLGRIWGN